MAKTQKQKRDEKAERVCREVRYQMAKHGGIADNQTLCELLLSWMKVTGKVKYERPKLSKNESKSITRTN